MLRRVRSFEAPYLRSRFVQLLEMLLAVVATAVLWMFMTHTLYEELVVYASPALWATINILVIAFVAALLVLGAWQAYNWLWFHDKHRRGEFRWQSLEEVAVLYGVSGSDMAVLQDVRQARGVHPNRARSSVVNRLAPPVGRCTRSTTVHRSSSAGRSRSGPLACRSCRRRRSRAMPSLTTPA